MRWLGILFLLLLFGAINSLFGIAQSGLSYYLLMFFVIYLAMGVHKLKVEHQELRQELHRLKQQIYKIPSQPPVFPEIHAPEISVQLQSDPSPQEESQPQPSVSVPDLEHNALLWKNAQSPEAYPASQTGWVAAQPAEPTALAQWFAEGNWIVRGGLAILFIGLVFLAKFAYTHMVIPLELRLAAIGVVGIVLLMIGWRSRLDRPAYGLSLQGGGIAILYLTVFATVKLTGQLPTAVALPLMLIVAVLAAFLAIRQDARILAIIGTIGGFLAPVLLSDGHGSHIGLFSYYALLNVGVMTIALHKAWRPLNFLAFVFTYGVAGLWGLNRYQPDFLISCLLFLILFFSMFVAISWLFTQHRIAADQTDSAIDASLLFGVPATTFGYAFYLLKPFEYGPAIAAIVLSAVYCSLAVAARNQTRVSVLTKPWAAIALLFATLAVPLACDARLTSSIWALEGAAVAWYGWQQQVPKARLFGYLLLVVGTVGYISHWPGLHDTILLFNAFSIGLLVLVAAFTVVGLAGNRFIKPAATDVTEAGLVSKLGAIGVAVSGGALLSTETYQRCLWQNAALLLPFLLWAWAWALQWLARIWQWPHLPVPAVVLPVFTLLLPISALVADKPDTANEQAVMTIGLLALLVWQALSLKKLLPQFSSSTMATKLLPTILIWPGSTVVAFWWLLLWRQRGLLDTVLSPDDSLGMRGWLIPLAALVPVLLLWWLSDFKYREPPNSPRWWQQLHGDQPLPAGSLAFQRYSFAGISLLYVLATTFFYSGSSSSYYLPVLNLFELVGVGGLLALWRFHKLTSSRWLKALSLLSFLFVNSIISRILANHFDARFEMGFAWNSAIAATTYSIVWTIAALAATWLAVKQGNRSLWIAGAGLLVIVAIKLIAIDLAQGSSLTRIISFLGVGALMLVIGYVAPIPKDEQK